MANQRRLFQQRLSGGEEMIVAELIKELEKMPQDKEVIMFDGPSYYTPSKVYICDWKEKRFNGKVVID